MSDKLADVVEVINPAGKAPVLLLCEHAARHIPGRYHGLGLAPEDRDSHAAWDLGARALAVNISRRLDAPLVASRVSRLVYDCNRPPHDLSAMPAQSEVIRVPGNRNLTAEERDERYETVYRPFQHAVCTTFASRPENCALVTIHSFTPTYHATPREVEVGILHDDDTRLADAMLARSGTLPDRKIARNEPYGPTDGVTHTLREFGVAKRRLNVMIEVRNDLLRPAEGAAQLAGEMLKLLRPALAGFQLGSTSHA